MDIRLYTYVIILIDQKFGAHSQKMNYFLMLATVVFFFFSVTLFLTSMCR